MPNALVIGLGGVGSVIGRKLHDYDCFDRIILADVDPTYAQVLHNATKRSRFEVLPLNAMETAKVAAVMTEHKIAVTLNACNCYTNYSILEACHRAGSHYIDMAADIYSAPGVKKALKNSFEAEIEKFNQAFLEKDLAGLLCLGCDPGAVNIFARWAMDRLDTASSIRVLDADNAEVKGYRFAVLFSPETLFEELNAVPYFVKEGCRHRRPVRSKPKWIATPLSPRSHRLAKDLRGRPRRRRLPRHPPAGLSKRASNIPVFKYGISDQMVNVAKSIDLLNLDTWKKVKVDGVEVAPIRVATANLPKPAQLGATVDGYSCVVAPKSAGPRSGSASNTSSTRWIATAMPMKSGVTRSPSSRPASHPHSPRGCWSPARSRNAGL